MSSFFDFFPPTHLAYEILPGKSEWEKRANEEDRRTTLAWRSAVNAETREATRHFYDAARLHMRAADHAKYMARHVW